LQVTKKLERGSFEERSMATAEERDLVSRMRAGDESAFDAFADHYIPGLYRFAVRRLGQQRELAREIVQTSVCKVLEGLDSYRGDAPLFTWLCACCRNEIALHYRRQNSHPTVHLVGDDERSAPSTLPSRAAGPEEQLLETELRGLVHLALDHLPPAYASVLEWKYLEELPVHEIARRLQLGDKAAESMLTRARKAFRETYERLKG